MQRAAAYRALGRYDDAEKQLAALRDNGNFEEWYGLVELEKTNLASARSAGNDASDSTLAAIDTLSPGKGYSAYAIYERGVRAYRLGDYQVALTNFTKVQSASVPFQRRAARYSALLGRYFEQLGRAGALTQGYTPDAFPDSLRAPVAESYYSIARVFASLEKLDGTLLEAGADLGGSPASTFWRVTVPLTLPGMVAGIVLVFVPSLGQFVVSDLLGGAKTVLVGNLIQNQFAIARNKPFGAAIAFELTLVVLLLLWGWSAFARRRGEEGLG